MLLRLARAFKHRLHRGRLSLIRVGGTLSFAVLVLVARILGLLPRAYRPDRDTPSIMVVALTPHMGDAIMLTPLLEALHAAHPGLPVDLVMEEHAASLFERTPEIRRLYALRLGTVPPISISANIRRVGAVVREYWKHLREARPALCLMPRWGDDLFRSSYLALLTGAPRRIGFASDVGSPPLRAAAYRDRLLTEVVQGGNGLHEPSRMVLLAQRAGLLPQGAESTAGHGVSKAVLLLADTVSWSALRARLQLPDGRYVVIAPGASQAKKMWPEESWLAVLATIRDLDLAVVLLSGAADRAIAEHLHAAHHEQSTLVAGTTTFAESAALLQHATAFLGNDSGPAHMAGALGIPTVVLFTTSRAASGDDPFSPRRNRPMGPNVLVVQPEQSVPPCTATCDASEPHCIRAITPDQVLAVVTPVLAAAPREGQSR